MIYAGIAVAVLFLIWMIIRAWNLPKVVEWRAKRTAERQKNRTERVRIRRDRKRRPELPEQPEGGKIIKINKRRDRWFRRKDRESK